MAGCGYETRRSSCFHPSLKGGGSPRQPKDPLTPIYSLLGEPPAPQRGRSPKGERVVSLKERLSLTITITMEENSPRGTRICGMPDVKRLQAEYYPDPFLCHLVYPIT